MYHADFIVRETALARCPDAWCRRTGRCRAGHEGVTPCRRTHESMDAFRERIIEKIAEIMREFGHPGPPQPVDEDSLDFQLKYADLKRAFEERLKAEDNKKPRRP